LKKANGLFLVLIMSFLCIQSVGAMDKYCHDKESWNEWEALVQKYPGDMDLHSLHALRLGLCAKVSRGDLTVKEATDIFERAKETIIEKKKAEGPVSGKLGL